MDSFVLDQTAKDCIRIMAEAGCTSIATVRVTARVWDLGFKNPVDGLILVRCGAFADKLTPTELSDLAAQRTFDRVVLVHDDAKSTPQSAIDIWSLETFESNVPSLAVQPRSGRH